MSTRRFLALIVLLVVTGGLLYGLQSPVGGLPPLGTLLDPADGLYRTARQAVPDSDSTTLRLEGLEEPVTIHRDQRHVPHIYASTDRDATIALGYVAAKDRLFQLDFLPRVASGRLAEAFGRGALSSDRFLRQTGMEWGAQKNLDRIQEQDGIERRVLEWYGQGVNAYLDRLAPKDLPFEFRLLGYSPDRYTPIQALRIAQYMNFDLTYDTDDPAYSQLQRALDSTAYRLLYPEHPHGLFEPIIPPDERLRAEGETASVDPSARTRPGRHPALDARRAGRQAVESFLGVGDHPSTGSNNWAVADQRSLSEAPILAGDMHLSLSLPSIWYEAHLVTPTTNAYGLTIPGVPVFIQAFNQDVGWTLTNTGADQIDHLALTVDSARTRYRYEGEWRPLRRVVDTIAVKDAEPVLDTIYYSHQGPVHFDDTISDSTEYISAIAERWTAHDSSRTLRALWEMNRATSVSELTAALRFWDSPMQNVLYAGREEGIAIRSAGYLPVRRAGHGRGLVDGSTDDFEWIDRVPFDSLPAAHNPAQGFLSSTNQKPTGPDYPYYLGHDWRTGYRSLRIDSLLRRHSAHGVGDFQRYQADVNVQQRHVFVPFLRGLSGVSARADSLRRMLQTWNGEAQVDRPEPLVMDEFLQALHHFTWDESVFAGAPDPSDASLVHLLETTPDSEWLDIQATDPVEDAEGLLTHVLEATADSMASRYGWRPDSWRWGDHHTLLFQHLSGADPLRPLGRGPFEYPGFDATLSPARGRTATHSASQRVVVDFSTDSPTAKGVYPGGQSGRPLDPYFYDTHIPTYLDFEYFDLHTPEADSAFSSEDIRSTTLLRPPE